MAKEKKDKEIKVEVEKVTIKSNPEVIDALMRNRINKAPIKGGKIGRRIPEDTWSENELELRNAVIYDLVLRMSREMAAREISTRWDVSMSTARRYIAYAVQCLVDNYKDEGEEEVKKTYKDRIEKIMNDALKEGNYKVALSALEMLNKMNGFYSEKKEINLNDGQINFNFQE